MKVCAYCNTRNEDSASHCVSCNGSVFEYICGNCGRQFGGGAYCPACGVKVGQAPRVCPECGTKYYSNACPNCGYTRQRRVQQSQAESQPQPVVHNHYTIQNNPAPERSAPQSAPRSNNIGCGTILLWIFFFPIMLVVTLFKSNLKPITKVILFLLLLGLLCGGYKYGNGEGLPETEITSEITVCEPAFH